VPRINEAFLNLQASYLFAEVKRRSQAYREAHPEARLIDLGIGDVTLPLPPAVVRALEVAVGEQASAETLKGYGPYIGYEFLRGEIAAHDFGAQRRTVFQRRETDSRTQIGESTQFTAQAQKPSLRPQVIGVVIKGGTSHRAQKHSRRRQACRDGRTQQYRRRGHRPAQELR